VTGNGRYDSGTKLDFRAKAVIGYPFRIPFEHLIVEEESDWSGVQTITITHGTSSTKPPQTTNPPVIQPSAPDNPPQSQNPSQLYLIIIACSACVIAALLGVIVYLLIKQRKTKPLHNSTEIGEKTCVNE